VDSISHKEIKETYILLKKHGIRYRQLKVTLVIVSGSCWIPFEEKKRIEEEELRYTIKVTCWRGSSLCEDEKGPIIVAAKTHMMEVYTSCWSLTQSSRISKAQQKTKGILNVFGVYDYTNDHRWCGHTHGYKARRLENSF
jgi:hypothetical protein